MLYKILWYCILVRLIQTYVDPIAFDVKFGALPPLAVYALIGLACRFAYEIVKKLVWLLTLPFAWVSFGLIGIVINVVLVYLVQYTINHSGMGITMLSPGVVQVVGFAGVMTVWSMFVNMIL